MFKQKVIRSCDECKLGYFKPWYEPMWLANREWQKAHVEYHDNNNIRAERERIMQLMKEYSSKIYSLTFSGQIAVDTILLMIELIDSGLNPDEFIEQRNKKQYEVNFKAWENGAKNVQK